jgi:hypothetical protein
LLCISNFVGKFRKFQITIDGTFSETAIVVYRLPTKENKLQFFVSVCSKQTKDCRFHFRLQQTMPAKTVVTTLQCYS